MLVEANDCHFVPALTIDDLLIYSELMSDFIVVHKSKLLVGVIFPSSLNHINMVHSPILFRLSPLKKALQ